MKIPTARIDAFVHNPDPKARAVLLFGNDQGLIRERADAVARSVVPDLADPFRIAVLRGAQIDKDPALLADEAAAIAFGGGRRVVRIEDAADSCTAALKSFLGDPRGDALILLEAGALEKRSTLRGLCDRAANAAALQCFVDEGRVLETFIKQTLGELGMTPSRDALGYLIDSLGADRQATRRELEKLAVYMNAPAKGAAVRVELEDVKQCIGDGAAFSLDDLAFAVASGNMPEADHVLHHLFGEGTASVAVLRALARHFHRLQWINAAMKNGDSPEGAVAALKPPIFFKRTEQFAAQARAWSSDACIDVLRRLMEAELQCKTTGQPDQLICSQTLLAIASRVRARR